MLFRVFSYGFGADIGFYSLPTMTDDNSASGSVKKQEDKAPDSSELRDNSSKSVGGGGRRRPRCLLNFVDSESDEPNIDDSDLDPDFVLEKELDSDDGLPCKLLEKGKKRKKVFSKKKSVVAKVGVRGGASVGVGGSGGVSVPSGSRKCLDSKDYANILLSSDSDNDNETNPKKNGNDNVNVSGNDNDSVGVDDGARRPLVVGGDGDSENDNVNVSDNVNVNVSGARQKRQVRKEGRKSEEHKSEWAVNVSKRKRNSGEEYISYRTKKVMPPRKVGPPCKDGCYNKVGTDNIEQIHKLFWGIAEYNKQNEYLIRCISEVPFKRKYTKKAVSKRPAKILYKIIHAGIEYEVCREGFLNIFGIKRGKLEVILNKIRETKAASGVIPEDKRGKTVPVNKIVGPVSDCMHEFIRELPVVSSHYTRAKAPLRQYLPAGGSITGLYSEFQLWMRINHPDVNVVSGNFFRKTFTKYYNIEFAPPKKDVCNFCSEIDIKIGNLETATSEQDVNKRTQLEEKKKAHLEDARRTREMMKDPLNKQPLDEGFRAIAIDLQQQQLCPKMPVNRAYYASKLYFRNFCVFDLTSNKANMFPWDETAGNRGPNEIVSCIVRWLQHVRETEGKPVTNLRIFADNCAGQNKNIYLVLFLLQQVQQNLLKRVDVIFLVSGHSYMHCDQAFGLIEKAFRNEGYICSIPHYIELLKKACKSNSFNVFVMERNHFFDIKALEKFVTNRSKGILSKAKQFVLKKSSKEGFFIKNHYNFADHEMTYIDLRKGRQSAKPAGRGRPTQDESLLIANAPLSYKYPSERKLKKKKIKSLETLLCMIPDPAALEWFTNLINRQNALHASAPDAEEDAMESDDQLSEDEDNPGNILLTDADVIFNPDVSSASEEEDSSA